MRIKPFCLIPLFSLVFFACGEKMVVKPYNEGLHIIPEPERITQQTGEFVLNPNTLFIIDNDTLDAVAGYFKYKIKQSTGYQLADGQEAERNYIRLALDTPQVAGEVYNITNGEPRVFRDLIEETLRGLGYPIRYRKIPAPLVSAISSSLEFIYKNLKLKGEPALTRYTYYLLRYSQTLDISKAERDLGYRPKITISEGIEQYVQDYRKH